MLARYRYPGTPCFWIGRRLSVDPISTSCQHTKHRDRRRRAREFWTGWRIAWAPPSRCGKQNLPAHHEAKCIPV